jgi:saccharopine dehydrogenase-like NADP-dependent oxidoreductase
MNKATILLIGTGKSSSYLIKYLVDNAEAEDWKIIITDQNLSTVKHLESNPRVVLVSIDINNYDERVELIQQSNLVISMLPAFMHPIVAKDCVRFKRHMVTASYVSSDMEALHQDAVLNGVTLMNEIGVDPGIDHLSAKQVLDRLKATGAKMNIFESFTGGLVAPEYDNNPWGYKFTWNPRNVVVAGQGGAVKFVQEGQYKYIPYNKVFRRTEKISIDNFGLFEGYANRDSLRYRSVYGLDDIPTIYRGTLRRVGFCRAWDIFVQLGATDDSYVMENTEHMTYRQFINSFLAYNPYDSVELKLMHYLHLDQDNPILEKLEWLGIFSNKKIGLKRATPAQILQKILEEKWSLEPNDKDMIVMYHKFGYELDGALKMIDSSMVCIGDDQTYTAMAKTVGLPVAIATKLILNGTIQQRGVVMPIDSKIYTPMLAELSEFGITFNEREIEYQGY